MTVSGDFSRDTPWPSILVTIDTLGSQGVLGSGVLVSDSIVLTSRSVVGDAPIVVIESPVVSAQAEVIDLDRVGDPDDAIVVVRLLEAARTAPLGFSRLEPGAACELVARDADGRLDTIDGVAGPDADALVAIDIIDGSSRAGAVEAGSPVLVRGLLAGVVVPRRPGEPADRRSDRHDRRATLAIAPRVRRGPVRDHRRRGTADRGGDRVNG